MSQHPGIRLRVTAPSGVLVEGDSDWLYYSAKFGHGVDGFSEIVRHEQDGAPLLVIEIAPILLDDMPPDPEE